MTIIDKSFGKITGFGVAIATAIFDFLYQRNLSVALYSILFSLILFALYFYFFNIKTLESRLKEKEQEIKLSYEVKINDLNEKIKTLSNEKENTIQENIRYREQIFQLTEQLHLQQFNDIIKSVQSTQQELKEHFKTYNKE